MHAQGQQPGSCLGWGAACTRSPSALGSGGLAALWLRKPLTVLAAARASPCLPASARVPVTALVPRCPHCHSSPPRCRGSGTAGSMQGSCHGTRCTGNMAEPGSLPPACGQPARPGKARDSLGLPAQEPFPPALPGHSPTGGSSLASSFQAGAGGLGSGLSCASPGHSPSPRARGWAMPGRAMGHRCLTAVCSGEGCRARAWLPVLPAPRQALWPREFVSRVLAACSQGGGGGQTIGAEMGKPFDVQWESPPSSNQYQQHRRVAMEERVSWGELWPEHHILPPITAPVATPTPAPEG